ncbi:hypothetical protein Aph01nite_72700 [Acrocarpospora phusangensis]|uniref:Secreted protein n=1 Tax=Acrocarpospora phusangensis TaxID=1070424 RepID=A0A919QMG8_9ACTN|nr:hypothetical protein [Acrocarpospora phusangensis]GIH28960.1 hypothetical protein Aph01nite_72700 [Acrocarpospora phusangensis]
MKITSRKGALAVGAVFAAAAIVSVGGSAANATQADCASWPNPGSATGASTVYRQDVGRLGTYAELRKGTLNGQQIGWARITGTTKKGDLVWMDVSNNGGASWTQCGPYTVDADGGIPYTRGYATSSSASRVFRACGRVTGAYSVCGPWW